MSRAGEEGMAGNDLYAVLGVDSSASDADIKKGGARTPLLGTPLDLHSPATCFTCVAQTDGIFLNPQLG